MQLPEFLFLFLAIVGGGTAVAIPVWLFMMRFRRKPQPGSSLGELAALSDEYLTAEFHRLSDIIMIGKLCDMPSAPGAAARIQEVQFVMALRYVQDYEDKTMLNIGVADLQKLKRLLEECGFNLANRKGLAEAEKMVADMLQGNLEYLWYVASMECEECDYRCVSVYPGCCERIECPGCHCMMPTPPVDEADLLKEKE